MQCGVLPDLCAARQISGWSARCGVECFPTATYGPIARAMVFRTITSSKFLYTPHLSRRFVPVGIGLGSKPFRVRAQSSSGGDGVEKSGDKEVQEMLVEIVRLETGKVRVNEFVEEQAKHLADIAETANEEYARIAEEARRSMDAAGSKVLEEMDIKASAFEEELAAARAQIEADEADLEAFEKNVEQARSEGLFFKELYKTVKTKSPEEQQQIKEKAEVVTDTIRKSAGSKSRRILYGVLIFLLTLSIIEAGSSANVQLPKLAVYIFILLALIVQLTYENMLSGKNKQGDKED
ncbi:hypothetical protein MPTK2_3g15860 [Marchantia polymorpha subsp. ruderalis]